MTLASLLILLLVVAILYVFITWLLPQPMQKIALAILGVFAVIYLLGAIWPGLLHFRIAP